MRDKNPRVRAAAASTLGELHATNTIPALKAALSDKDPSVMLAATHALYVLKDPVAYEIYYAILMGDKKTSAGVIHSQIDRLKDPKQVAQMGFEEGIADSFPYAGIGYEAYRQLMKHYDNFTGARSGRPLPGPRSGSLFLKLTRFLFRWHWRDKNVIVREAAIDALAERNDSKCIERLATNLDDNKYPVRYRSAATIIHLGGATPPAAGSQANHLAPHEPLEPL